MWYTESILLLVVVQSFSRVWLFATPRTAASRLPCPSLFLGEHLIILYSIVYVYLCLCKCISFFFFSFTNGTYSNAWNASNLLFVINVFEEHYNVHGNILTLILKLTWILKYLLIQIFQVHCMVQWTIKKETWWSMRNLILF